MDCYTLGATVSVFLSTVIDTTRCYVSGNVAIVAPGYAHVCLLSGGGGGGGGFLLAFEGFWRMFNNLFPACAFIYNPRPSSLPYNYRGACYIGITLSVRPSVLLSVCPSLSGRYLLYRSTDFNQTWYGGVLSSDGVSCRKIDSSLFKVKGTKRACIIKI